MKSLKVGARLLAKTYKLVEICFAPEVEYGPSSNCRSFKVMTENYRSAEGQHPATWMKELQDLKSSGIGLTLLFCLLKEC